MLSYTHVLLAVIALLLALLYDAHRRTLLALEEALKELRGFRKQISNTLTPESPDDGHQITGFPSWTYNAILRIEQDMEIFRKGVHRITGELPSRQPPPER